MGFLFYIMEIWKNIEGFEDYQISNFGNVKSLKFEKERMLNPGVDSRGYYNINLYKNNKKITKKIHQLASVAFLNHKPEGMKFVVNHRDFNKLNNNVSNLEIVTQRENANQKHLKSSSVYTGVNWEKNANKWRSRIVINGKQKHLGLFHTEYDAHLAYQNKLKNIC